MKTESNISGTCEANVHQFCVLELSDHTGVLITERALPVKVDELLSRLWESDHAP